MAGDDPIHDPKPTPTQLLRRLQHLVIQRMPTCQTTSAPTYVDNYVSIADWSKRSQWNLANVHDPSVIKAADGYYYMYQTDASYGICPRRSYGHFHARRSKDLVNWGISRWYDDGGSCLGED